MRMKPKSLITRRELLKAMGVITAGTAAAACGAPKRPDDIGPWEPIANRPSPFERYGYTVKLRIDKTPQNDTEFKQVVLAALIQEADGNDIFDSQKLGLDLIDQRVWYKHGEIVRAMLIADLDGEIAFYTDYFDYDLEYADAKSREELRESGFYILTRAAAYSDFDHNQETGACIATQIYESPGTQQIGPFSNEQHNITGMSFYLLENQQYRLEVSGYYAFQAGRDEKGNFLELVGSGDLIIPVPIGELATLDCKPKE
jgi:hypothetical protein